MISLENLTVHGVNAHSLYDIVLDLGIDKA
jgi:hypothetical protein